jgi:hypothetical protein
VSHFKNPYILLFYWGGPRTGGSRAPRSPSGDAQGGETTEGCFAAEACDERSNPEDRVCRGVDAIGAEAEGADLAEGS